MQLKNGELIWNPKGAILLTVIPKGRQAPKTMDDFLVLQEMMLNRLVKEERENGGDLKLAELTLEEMPDEVLLALPLEPTFDNPDLPGKLIGAIHPILTGRVMKAIAEGTKPGLTPEMMDAVEALDLVGWIQQMLTP